MPSKELIVPKFRTAKRKDGSTYVYPLGSGAKAKSKPGTPKKPYREFDGKRYIFEKYNMDEKDAEKLLKS